MDDERTAADSPWERRALPSEDAVHTAVCVAPDGCTIRADVCQAPLDKGGLRTLAVTVEPLELPEGGWRERWPNVEEIKTAADCLLPGVLLSVQLFGNPPGVIPGTPGPLEMPRTIYANEVGALRQRDLTGGTIEVVRG